MEHLFSKLKPILPIPTGLTPVIRKIPGIRSVIFDIYGTLVISASGDIGAQNLKGATALLTFGDCHIKLSPDLTFEEHGLAITQLYELKIRQAHGRGRDMGRPHPEVNIVIIWEEVIRSLTQSGHIIHQPRDLDIEVLAFTFEIYNNAVFPMPNMSEALYELSHQKIQLGIVSNAQFFTPLLLKHFLKSPADDALPLFHPNLQIYSYELERAKPDNHLYNVLADHLALMDLTPSQCLYVGNDMLNDIVPASEEGFHTALFAGDQRSLRERKDHERCKDAKPDTIITNLSQILDIIKA